MPFSPEAGSCQVQPVASSRPQGVVVVTSVDVRAQNINRAHIQLFQGHHSYTSHVLQPPGSPPHQKHSAEDWGQLVWKWPCRLGH